MKVYADNAATTKISDVALSAMLQGCHYHFANAAALHTPGQRALEELEWARKTMADGLGCDAGEILFTSGGTEADNQAIRSAAAAGAKGGKRHMVSTAFEHHAVLHPLKQLEKEGFAVTLVPVPEDGIVPVADIREAIREDTCLVTVMYANNEIGTIQHISDIGALCRERGVLFHTDAVQAVGHIPIDVRRESVDLLSASAHKFHGPKGVGLLYARKGVPLIPLLQGGGQERGLRPGTDNVPAVLGMAAQFHEACCAMEENAKKTTVLRDRLMDGLRAIPHSLVNGDETKRLPGNVHLCFEGIEGESLLLLLDQAGVYASSGSACTSASLEPSHVLLAIGRPHEIAHGSLRLSLSTENTVEEVDYMVETVAKTVAYLRGISPLWRDLQEGRKSYVIQ